MFKQKVQKWADQYMEFPKFPVAEWYTAGQISSREFICLARKIHSFADCDTENHKADTFIILTNLICCLEKNDYFQYTIQWTWKYL